MFSIKRFIRSFRYASRGLLQVFYEEQSFRVQVFIGAFILFLALYLKVAIWQIIVLILIIISVLVLELINSIFERVVDIIKPGIHEYARIIKDIMAATVLLASIAAAIIGVLIFWPYFL